MRVTGKISNRTALIVVFVLSLVLRLTAVFVAKTYQIDDADNHWAFGYEVGRVAQSIAAGSGYASPMRVESGPTAWFAPVFPLLLATVFKIFGVYTAQSAIAIYVINSFCSALTSVLLYWIAKPLFGSTVGLASAVLFALYPAAVWHSINTIWNTSLMACAMVLLVGLLVRAMTDSSYKLNLAAAVAMGTILLIDPSPGFSYPFALGLLYLAQRNSRYAIRNIVMLAVLPLLVFGPWMLRNYLVLGTFTPRCCPGLELKLGNNETSWRLGSAGFVASMHPTNSEEELGLYLQMGEAGYNKRCMAQAVQFIRENPGKFLELTRIRFVSWWIGEATSWQGHLHSGLPLALFKRTVYLLPVPFFLIGAIVARRNPAAQMVLLLVVTYPVPYYFVHVNERYRFPIEPLLVLLAAEGLAVALRWLKSWRSPTIPPTDLIHQPS
jgi:4-amino-4-deoxy-L-arabinose transferase-like glycosyltransferase